LTHQTINNAAYRLRIGKALKIQICINKKQTPIHKFKTTKTAILSQALTLNIDAEKNNNAKF